MTNTPVSTYNSSFYIDVHAHVFQDFYASAMQAAGITSIGGWHLPQWSVDEMLKGAEEHKIASQLLSLSSPGISFVSHQKAIDLARQVNEYMAVLVKDHSPRFGSLATLPLPDVDGSLAEIAYALDTLGMDGVGLLSNYNGLYLGDPKLDPIMAELNRRQAVVFVHPSDPPYYEAVINGLSAPVLEYPFDSTRMAQNLVQTGSKSKYPDISIIVAHGGGTLPYLYQRLVGAMQGKNDIFNSFFFDLTATTDAAQIHALLSLSTPRRCMMGFDFPFMKPRDYDGYQMGLESYGLPLEDLHAMQHLTALRLFPKVAQRLRKAGTLG